MLAKNSFKRVLKIYVLSMLLYLVVMVISIIVHIKLRLGDSPAFPKAVILVLIFSLFFAIYIAIANLTQFLVVKWKKLHVLAYFLPILFPLAAYIHTSIYDSSNTGIAIVYFVVQVVTTIIAYYLYQRKNDS